MQITPLEIGLAVAAITVIFGPKKLPTFSKSEPTAYEMVATSELGPANWAAARAKSPVRARREEVEHQFAMGASRPAPLPHELLF